VLYWIRQCIFVAGFLKVLPTLHVIVSIYIVHSDIRVSLHVQDRDREWAKFYGRDLFLLKQRANVTSNNRFSRTSGGMEW